MSDKIEDVNSQTEIIEATDKAISSNQWNALLSAPVNVSNGTLENILALLDNTSDKESSGTTSYDEYDLSYSISITLSGTSGTANINVDGTDYLATFSSDLFTTASNWVSTNKAALNAIGIQVFALGSGADGRIRFGSLSDTDLDAITIINATGDLAGTIANEFTGSSTADYSHLVIPYTGKPYVNSRLLHTIRCNFEIDTGSVQTATFGLFRFEDDSQIGSNIQISRNTDVSGNLIVIETYTAFGTDPFVTGGFYLALVNNSGQTLTLDNNVGFLIQTIFERSFDFTP